MSALDLFQQDAKPEVMTLEQYLEGCKKHPDYYATAAERMLKAIGEPELFNSQKDKRLGRVFGNSTIRRYEAFVDFYGLEDVVERIVQFFKHAAQGLEESKQVLYLLGPVGGGKSSLAERLKRVMEYQPIYVIAKKASERGSKETTGPLYQAADGVYYEASPVFESPLGLFDRDKHGAALEETYGIPQRRLVTVPSPWARKRLREEFKGDMKKFYVLKLTPSRRDQIAIAKTEPGDENNQDISTLVGKIDLRKLELYGQNDADAYGYAGGLNRGNQGLLEFVEMFKAPIKMLHPLLTATQERNYAGTENVGNLPFEGLILAHSNEAEWQSFKGNKNNEAFIDRVYIIQVPYCLRYTEEARIYDKLIRGSELAGAPCAPGTLEMLAQMWVMSRLKEHENSDLYLKMKVYNGDDQKDASPKVKPLQEYRDAAGLDEGMGGLSTRLAFKVLAATYNHDTYEVAADPVHLMYEIERTIRREQFPKEKEQLLLAKMKTELAKRYAEFIGKEINSAYLESADEYGQNLFDRYIDWADAWIEDTDFKDRDTGQLMNRELLNTELTKIEKPAGISNPKDFRNEIVKFALRHRSAHSGKNPSWTAYEKMREVIEKRMFHSLEDILPVISFGSKKDSETEKKHQEFLGRMKGKGYTEIQVRRLVEWYGRTKQSS